MEREGPSRDFGKVRKFGKGRNVARFWQSPKIWKGRERREILAKSENLEREGTSRVLAKAAVTGVESRGFSVDSEIVEREATDLANFWQSPKIWKGRDRIPVIACREFWQSPKMWKGRERNPVIGL